MRFAFAAFVVGVIGTAFAEDARTPETFLPLADGRDAFSPAAAFGKDVFLVAWQSGNLEEGDLRKGINYGGDIVACRVDAAGKALDAKPFSICAAKDMQEKPRIAFGDGVFLVVWNDLRSEKDWDVYAARVTPAGKVLDPDGFLVAGGKHNQALPQVAWDGKTFLVVWQDARSGTRYEVYGARVSPEGKVLDVDGHVLATEKAPVSRFGPVVASDASAGKSLLFWLGIHNNNLRRPLAGTQFVQDGKVVDQPTYETPPIGTGERKAPGGQYGQFPMSLAAGPKGYLASWTTSIFLGRGAATNDAHAAIFKPDGQLLKTFLLTGTRDKESPRIRNPHSAWDGTSFVAAWDMGGNARPPAEKVFFTRVSSEGTPSETQLVAGTAESPAIKPVVASTGAGTTLIAYEQHPATGETPVKIGFRMLRPK
ncbi:MAG: hypothetical protein JNM56_39050 [Planctomycetia bacterium]|nr:hypothetical protein [Planctomycetia bacterium]